MARCDIKLSKDQHEMLLRRFGSEDTIRDWIEASINQTLLDLVRAKSNPRRLHN